ncbi:MAG: transcriptional regulator [Thermoplasmata archaeon]|nr:winged helix-turn-helix transcriptional regulator [Euryarchaeota archaeon]RLF64957.1 MAG: transcriptional regulator [Thermoplasmata archaeon]
MKMKTIKIRTIIGRMENTKCKETLTKIVNEEYLDIELRLPDDKQVRTLERILAAIQNPTRMKILGLLAQAELPVCLITEVLGLDQTLVSHHLRVLRGAGLVDVKVFGKYRFYCLKDHKEVLELIMKILKEGLEKK